MVKKLGEILIAAGLIDNIQLEAALGRQKTWGGKLGHSLIELGFVNEEELAEAISKAIRIPYVNLFDPPLVEKQIKLLAPDLARKYEVVPTSLRNNILYVAMADPFDLDTISELQFITNLKISPVLALDSEIKDAIRKYYDGEVVDRKPTKKSNSGNLEIIRPKEMSDSLQNDQHEKELRLEALVDLLIDEGIITRENFAKMLLIKRAGA
jgi:type IV pilus assembly protein PilB